MNEIQNSIFEAMRLFSDDSIRNSNATLTVKGKVTEILDAGKNTYKVEYLDNSFTVSANSNIQYSVGDIVHILVPDGDFSNDKFIVGSANPTAKNYITQVGDSQNYYDISDNFINFDEIKMSSYDTTKETVEIVGINEVLEGYLKNYRTFAFSFKAMTDLHIDQQVNGNYGVSLNIPLLAAAEDGSGLKPVIKNYTLDVGNMLGNPYRLHAWSPQSLMFSIDEQYQLDTTKNPTITYFCYDFKQNENKINIKDIFIKDISFKVVEMLTEQDYQGYKLTLKASGGEYFLTEGKKEITPTLRVNGNITSYQKRDCYWFIEDASITPGKSEYVNYGGYGWKCLNKKENIITSDDGSQVFNFNTNQYSLEIDSTEVNGETRFKCIIIYEGDIISSIITLRNLDNNKNMELYPTNGNTTFIKNAGYIDLTVSIHEKDFTDKDKNREYIKYIWTRFDKFGRLIENTNDIVTVVNYNSIVSKDSKSYFETRIKFPANEVEEYNMVYCSAYKIVDGIDKLIGTKSLMVSVSEDFIYKLVINNGDKIYKYDADGDSPMVEAYDGPVSSKVNEIEALSYQIFKADGIELTPDEYKQCKYTWKIPKKSMIEIDTILLQGTEQTSDEYYLISGKGNDIQIPYNIARRYDKSKAQNNIALQVDFSGNLLDNIINIKFLKDGDSGTNGTKYAAVMVMGSRESGVGYGTRNAAGYSQKLKFIYNVADNIWYWHNTENNMLGSWNNRKNLDVRVYENGRLLNTSGYSVSYSMFDSKVTNPCFTLTPVGSGVRIDIKQTPTLEGIYSNIVQAKITINKQGNSSVVNENTVLYAYYPIELTVVNFIPSIIPSLDGGFSEVLYSSDGTNPEWDETEPFYCNDSILDEDIRKYYTYSWDYQHHLRPGYIKTDNGQLSLQPDSKYDDGDSLNYVRVSLNFNKNLKSELDTKKTDLLNQNVLYNRYINDLTLLKEQVDSAYVKYKNILLSEFLSIKVFLEIRYYIYHELDYIENTLLKNLDSYFNTQKKKGIDILKNNPDLEKELLDLKEAILNAKNALIDINSFNDLVLLENFKIDFDAISNLAHIKNIANTLQGELDNLNGYIFNYDYEIKNFKNLSINDLIKYHTFISALISVKDTIPAAAESLKDKVVTYVDQIYNTVAFNDIIKLYELIETNGFNLFYEVNLIDEDVSEYRELISNNNLEITNINNILATEGKQIVHIRPIVLLFNRYELSNINGWDGNKLDTGLNNEYLLAPQVGAGIKDTENTFTGVVMGMRNIYGNTDKNKVDVGLFGYSKGRQSYFLDAKEGTATFGMPGKGQIIIDPDNAEGDAVIYGGDFVSGSSGMKINLTKPSIAWGNNNFKVNSSGHITAKGGGSIAGWGIGDTTLKSKDNALTLDSANKKIFSSNHDSLGSRVDGFYLSHDGLSIGSRVQISSAGVLEVGYLGSGKHWTINGDGTNSYITYGTAGANGGIYLGTDSLKLGSKFAVDNEGNLTAKYLTANVGGNIGGWIIGSNNLSANGITLSSNGSISTSKWNLNSNGSATIGNLSIDTNGNITANGGNFNNITATGGTFKSITVDGNSVFKGALSGVSGDFSGTLVAASGTINSITATDLKIKNGTAENFTVTSGTIKLGDATLNENGLTVGSSGGKSTIGSFKIDGNSIYRGTWNVSGGTPPDVFMCSGSSYSYTIGGKSQSGWCFGVKNKFGVDNSGAMYCTSGKIGGWSIGSDKLTTSGEVSGVTVTVSMNWSGITMSESYSGTTSTVGWGNVIGAVKNANTTKGINQNVYIFTQKANPYKLVFTNGVLTSCVKEEQ